MRDSDTYMELFDEGRETEAKRMLLLLGKTRFGAPEEGHRLQLESITDLDRLERMVIRMLSASRWAELLDTP